MIEYPTLKIMRDQVARQIGDQTAGRQEKIDEWLNIHYAETCRSKPWPQLLRSSELEVALSVNAAYIYLPKEVEQLYFVMLENQEEAVQMALETIIRRASTQFQVGGEVCQFAEAGEFGRRLDFHSVPERLTLTTTGALAVSCVVHGPVTSKSPNATSQELREEGSISPSTGFTTTNLFADLFSVGIGSVDSGALISVVGATSGKTYATIGEGEATARYKRVRLMQPDALGSSVTVIWKKRPFKLISDNQAIEIPVGPEIVEATIATMMVNQREYNAAAIYHAQRAKDGVEELFRASSTQAGKVLQCTPEPLYRTKRIIVVN